MRQTAIVTGGAGFIGSYLCEHLLEQRHKVLCVDNLSVYSRENIKHLIEKKNFTFMQQDIRQRISISSGITHIYNLASPSAPKDFSEHPVATLAAGSVGVPQLLELAKRQRAKFLQISTDVLTASPEADQNKQLYMRSKQNAETYTQEYINQWNLDARILRLQPTYGPRMRRDDGRVIPTFINLALRDEPLTVYGKGNQTRSFSYITDSLNAIMLAMNQPKGTPISLPNSEKITILELAEKIISLTNSSSEIEFTSHPTDPAGDVVKPLRMLNDWKQEIPLDRGLEKTIEYFKKTA